MYRYSESCVCGSHCSGDSPVSLTYEWPKMVEDWRANHKHERINPLPAPGLVIGSGFDPAKFTPENMDNFEELKTE